MRWGMKLIAGLAMVVLLIVAVVWIGRLTLNVLKSDGGVGEPDPMFAVVEPTATRPPELDGETEGTRFEDNSAQWDISVQTPVDQTAEELARQAAEAPEDVP